MAFWTCQSCQSFYKCGAIFIGQPRSFALIIIISLISSAGRCVFRQAGSLDRPPPMTLINKSAELVSSGQNCPYEANEIPFFRPVQLGAAAHRPPRVNFSPRFAIRRPKFPPFLDAAKLKSLYVALRGENIWEWKKILVFSPFSLLKTSRLFTRLLSWYLLGFCLGHPNYRSESEAAHTSERVVTLQRSVKYHSFFVSFHCA